MDYRLYRRDGTKYPPGNKGLFEWAKDCANKDLLVVRQDEVGKYMISTVWLGINHRWVPGPPLIFETAVFKSGGLVEIVERYETEEDAIVGHIKTVDLYLTANKVKRN